MEHERKVMIPFGEGFLEALYRPASSGEDLPAAALLCHPHPEFRGSMHNRIVYHATRVCNELGLPTLRFNFRGVGLSDGTFDMGFGEKEDARAGYRFLRREYPGLRVVTLGYSFGAHIGFQLGCEEHGVAAMVGFGMPVDIMDFSFLESCEKPKLFIHGTRDEFGSPSLLRSFAATWSGENRLAFIKGADHFFLDRVEEVRDVLARRFPLFPDPGATDD
jgi:alpha/beta superfamily hydrolase